MRVLLQRVKQAKVEINGSLKGKIENGLLVLFCAMRGDVSSRIPTLTNKIANLRIFADENGKMNRSLIDISGSALIVSQFTLAADTSQGRRPGYSDALPAKLSEEIYREFINSMRQFCSVETGEFGADMQVSLINDGPVTIWIEA